jgi:hypothetical protein
LPVGARLAGEDDRKALVGLVNMLAEDLSMMRGKLGLNGVL